ncbi:MAG TPA: TraR/DksA C4-type zinc finger protein [Acidimicrobiales bacterium]
MDEARARHLLDDERARLLEIRSGIEVGEEDEQIVEESAAGQHPGDVGTDVADRSLDLGILEDVERELTDIDDALRRLEDGTYGQCEVCGRPIPDERLEANPTARYDVEHQQQVESAGRIAGDSTQQS